MTTAATAPTEQTLAVTGAEWVPIVPGVDWLCREPSEEMATIAAARVEAVYRAAFSGDAEVFERYALIGTVEQLLSKPEIFIGFGVIVVAHAYAELLVVDWRGVLDTEGEPLPVTSRALVHAVLHPDPDGSRPCLIAFLAWLHRWGTTRTALKNLPSPPAYRHH